MACAGEADKARYEKMTDTAQHDYPGMRDITGEYNLREITLK